MALSGQVSGSRQDRDDCQAWVRGLHHDAYQLQCLNEVTQNPTPAFFQAIIAQEKGIWLKQISCFDVLLTRRKKQNSIRNKTPHQPLP